MNHHLHCGNVADGVEHRAIFLGQLHGFGVLGLVPARQCHSDCDRFQHGRDTIAFDAFDVIFSLGKSIRFLVRISKKVECRQLTKAPCSKSYGRA